MPDYKGLTIRFNGDASGLISSLQQIDNATSRTTSMLQRINTAIKADPSNARLYSMQTQEITRLIGSQKDRIGQLNGKLAENGRNYRLASENVKKYTDKLAVAKSNLDELKQKFGSNYEWYRTHSGFTTDLFGFKQAEEDVANMQQALDQAKASQEGYREAMAHTRNEIELAKVKLGGLKDALFQNTDKFITASNVLAKYADGLDYVGTKLQTLGGILTVGGLAGVLTIGRSVLSETEEYGNAISKVGGYLEITGSELEHMSELALQFGKETRYSAVEAADAMSELAKGGMTQAQIEGGALDATLQLASAGNLSLAQAAETAVQAINVFGLDAADASQVADALAGAANRSTAEVNTLAESFRYVSGWAGLADYPIQDVSGALGLLADRGLQAEVAGTGLRNVMQRIGAPTDKAKKLLEEYGFEAYNAEGKMKPLVELVDELNDSFGDLADQERNEVLNAIFGARGLPAAVALMESGSEALEDYINATKRVGYAEVMAKAQMGEVGWALEYLRGEFETFQVNLGSAFTPLIVDTAKALENLLTRFNDLSKAEQMEWAKKLVDVALIGPKLLVAGTALKMLASGTRGLSTASRFMGELLNAAKDSGGAVVTFNNLGKAIEKTSGGATDAATGISLLKSGLVLLGVAAAAYIGYQLWKRYDEERKAEEKYNRVMERSASLMSDSAEAADEMAGSIGEAGAAAEDTRKQVREMTDTLDKFYDKVDERTKEVETSARLLDEAWATISELGGIENLEPEQVERLNGAIGILNSELGTNYALHSDTGGVIYDENDAVVTLTGSIYKLIEAKKAELRAEAYGELYKDAVKNELQAAEDYNAAVSEWAEAAAKKESLWASRGTDLFNIDEYNEWFHKEIDARNALDEASGNLEAARSDVERLGAAYDQAAQDAQRASEAMYNALAEHIIEYEGLQEAVDEATLSIADFAGLTEQEFAEMVAAADGDMAVLAQKLADWAASQPTAEVSFDADTSGVEEAKQDTESTVREVDQWVAEVAFKGDTVQLDEATQRAADAVEGVPPEYTVKLTAIDYISDAVAAAKRALSSLAGSYTPNPYRNRAAGGIRTHADGGIAVAAARYHAGGSIVNVPNTGYPLDLVGEAGAEAIVPLTNRRYSQPFVDLIADGVSRRMGGGTSYNLYINGARVNDDPQIRGQFIDLMQSLARKGAMNVGHN